MHAFVRSIKLAIQPSAFQRMLKLHRIVSHLSRVQPRAGLWHSHNRQIPRAYDVEGAYERWLQNILNVGLR